MMKKYSGVFCLLLGTALLLSLCGCGFTGANRSSAKAGDTEMQAAPSGAAVQPMQASPTPEPAPTPTPIPELTFPDGTVHMADEETLNLSWLRHADAELTASLLRQMPNLKSIDMGSDGAWTGNPEPLTYETASVERPAEASRDLTWADLRTLQGAAPGAEILYRFRFYGRDFTTLDEEMDLSHSQMADEGAAVREILPLMRRCRYLDMDSCGVSSEKMAEIRDAYPEMDVVWRIWFAMNTFTCRTDIELLVDSKFAAYMTDDQTQDLKYLTKVKFLDMGHNRSLNDWSFLSYMPNLEVCIITDSGWENLDMLKDLKHLEFLEACPIGHTYVDLSPLAGLTSLEHLNICGIGESDGWEALLNLTNLKRLWIGHWTASSFPEGAIEQIQAALPNTDINITELDAAVGSWRDDQGNGVPERYLLLREQMQYDNYWNILPTPENDPKYRPPWL